MTLNTDLVPSDAKDIGINITLILMWGSFIQEELYLLLDHSYASTCSYVSQGDSFIQEYTSTIYDWQYNIFTEFKQVAIRIWWKNKALKVESFIILAISQNIKPSKPS